MRNPRLLKEAVQAARTGVSLGSRHYNLACALALSGQVDEALAELEHSLQAGEISAAHVKQDGDWEGLREEARFQTLLER